MPRSKQKLLRSFDRHSTRLHRLSRAVRVHTAQVRTYLHFIYDSYSVCNNVYSELYTGLVSVVDGYMRFCERLRRLRVEAAGEGFERWVEELDDAIEEVWRGVVVLGGLVEAFWGRNRDVLESRA